MFSRILVCEGKRKSLLRCLLLYPSSTSTCSSKMLCSRKPFSQPAHYHGSLYVSPPASYVSQGQSGSTPSITYRLYVLSSPADSTWVWGWCSPPLGPAELCTRPAQCQDATESSKVYPKKQKLFSFNRNVPLQNLPSPQKKKSWQLKKKKITKNLEKVALSEREHKWASSFGLHN